MLRGKISDGLITNQEQCEGSKKQETPSTIGLGPYSKNIIQERTGICFPEKDNIYVNLDVNANKTDNNLTLKNVETTVTLGKVLIIPPDEIITISTGKSLTINGILDIKGHIIVEDGATFNNN